ncbi:MAG: class I SAM-dependent methyltransferase [Ginsengibacter sp.]
MISPLTSKNNTSLMDTFQSSDVISLYRQQLDIDVTPFFNGISTFHLYRCNETGYKFYHPYQLTGDGLFYETLQTRLGNGYYHEWKFENQLAFDHLSAGDRVLDIGCGTGHFLMKAKSKTDSVYGLELNENAIAECRQKGLIVFNELIEQHAANHAGEYDVVCMFQVLEHVYDVKAFFESALKVLRKGGKMIIGVPDSDPYFLGYDKYCTLNLPPHHMGLWNQRVFNKLTALYNLSVLKIEYDVKGRLLAHAYTRAKWMAGVKSLPGYHSFIDKIRIAVFALITIPQTLFLKFSRGLHGSHMAVLFQKN